MRLVFVAGLALCSSLAFGCQRSPAKPSRAECTQVAEHIAELIISHYTAHPTEWFAAVEAEEGDSGLPPELTQETFAGYLATEPGKTWLLMRRGQTLAGTQQGIDLCVSNATKAQAHCLLAAKTRDDVVACDDKHAKKDTSPGSGSTESK